MRGRVSIGMLIISIFVVAVLLLLIGSNIINNNTVSNNVTINNSVSDNITMINNISDNVNYTKITPFNISIDQEIQFPDYDPYNENIYYSNDIDTNYVLLDNHIIARWGNGSLKYIFVVPEGWVPCERWCFVSSDNNDNITYCADMICCSNNGTLYVYLKPSNSDVRDITKDIYPASYYNVGEIIAISPEGQLLWNVSLNSLMARLVIEGYKTENIGCSDVYIYAKNNLLYVYHCYNESVIDENGNLLFSICNVSEPAVADEDGNLYVVNAVTHNSSEHIISVDVNAIENPTYLIDVRTPGNIIESYYPNGTLKWRQYAASPVSRQIYGGFDILPLYNNGIIYAPSQELLTAISNNGSKLWAINISEYYLPVIDGYWGGWKDLFTEKGNYLIFPNMPFDSQNNLYLIYDRYNETFHYKPYIIVIAPNGSVISNRTLDFNPFSVLGAWFNIDPTSNIIYDVGQIEDENNGEYGWAITNFSRLTIDNICAFNSITGKMLWNFTIPMDNFISLTLNDSNYKTLIQENDNTIAAEFYNKPNCYYDQANCTYYLVNSSNVSFCWGNNICNIYTNNGIVYIFAHIYRYQYPIIFGQSKYVFIGGLYALNENNGKLLYSINTGPKIVPTLSPTIINEKIIYYYEGKTYIKKYIN